MTSGPHVARLSSLWRNWRHELRDAIRHRAADADSALDRATAIYMPNRAHAARIALKKLRYLAEFAVATGVSIDEERLGELRRAQEALGNLHDMTVLAKLINKTQFPDDAVEESVALAAVVASEVSRLHAKYVRDRNDIRTACDACRRGLEQEPRISLTIPAAAVLAIPVLASWYLRQHAESEHRRSKSRQRIQQPA